MSNQDQLVSRRVSALSDALGPLIRFFTQSRYSQRVGQRGICDFAVGNPHETPLPGFVEALQRWSAPQSTDWFAYKMNEPEAQAMVAESLRRRGRFNCCRARLGRTIRPSSSISPNATSSACQAGSSKCRATSASR